jgi:hypothetical protein
VVEPTPEAMAALWETPCDDPAIADLRYKVEASERGQLLLNPKGLRKFHRQLVGK